MTTARRDPGAEEPVAGPETAFAGADAPPSAVSCRDLTVRYENLTAIAGVNLDIPRGGITALVGPSGCGKSSFLLALNRLTDLIPGCRVTGRIRIAGMDALGRDADVRSLRCRVGMVFQKPNPFPLSIRENLAIPVREHRTRDPAEVEACVRDALDAVGLLEEVEGRLDAPATALSGGQQQRLCIARALTLRPEVLLMDEPCSALDPLASATVEEWIRSLRGRYTVAIVTHNLAQARRIADRTALFWRRKGAGTLVEEALTEPFFEAPTHELTRAYVAGLRG